MTTGNPAPTAANATCDNNARCYVFAAAYAHQSCTKYSNIRLSSSDAAGAPHAAAHAALSSSTANLAYIYIYIYIIFLICLTSPPGNNARVLTWLTKSSFRNLAHEELSFSNSGSPVTLSNAGRTRTCDLVHCTIRITFRLRANAGYGWLYCQHPHSTSHRGILPLHWPSGYQGPAGSCLLSRLPPTPTQRTLTRPTAARLATAAAGPQRYSPSSSASWCATSQVAATDTASSSTEYTATGVSPAWPRCCCGPARRR
jgi:hypothetical protein